MIPIDQLIRSRRKTIALIVTREGKLVVRAPLRVSRAQVEDAVAQKSAWIRERQAAVARLPRPVKKAFVSSESFLYLGKSYPLRIAPDGARGLALGEDQFELSSHNLHAARPAFIAWYRRQARAVLAERIRIQADRLGLRPTGLRISSARSRWGSCSNRGGLSFPWRLVLAPVEVVDYVVVHELVHLAVKNHSPAFWQRVAAAYPGYQQARRWLRDHNDLGDELLE